jgi:aldehyde dehydrogenase (NAD+)
MEINMENIQIVLNNQKNYFAVGETRNIQFRLMQLRRLRGVIKKHEMEILTALNKDLNKSAFEGYATELGMVYDEIRYVMKHLRQWTKPKIVKTPISQFPSVSRIYTEPYGVVLIMAPWNYPFQLAMEPLIGAIAAGNCVVIKPSKDSKYTSKIIADIIRKAFRPSYITVVSGGREANQNLLEGKFDYIFFTGSVAVGRVVMKAAAKHLTPVSLELGGKSPCIVDETADISVAAKRIVWGKFINAGQTCVAPDYILVHPAVKVRLINYIKKYIAQFYGKHPCSNDEYPKIINEKHFKRLLGLMEGGARVVVGGKYDEQTQQIEPTVLDKVQWNSDVMSQEIFGPILPIIEYEHISEAVNRINEHPKPLALYLFTQDRKIEKYVLKNTSYGGGCINDTVVHLATHYMPFGGVGESGMGGYHGRASFDTFTHKKSILKKSNCIDIPLRYPPYKNHISIIKRVMK